MAATDKEYRNQYILDIVFAVSSIVMLATIVWMLADDFNREYKTEQRHGGIQGVSTTTYQTTLALTSDSMAKQ